MLLFALSLSGCLGLPGLLTPDLDTTYSVSGRVTDTDGVGVPDVVISFGGLGETTTDDNGDFAMSGLQGEVDVTPAKDGYSFTPPTQTVSQADDALLFEAVAEAPSLSGKIVFTSNRDNEYNRDIYAMNADGSGSVVRLTTDEHADFDPAWSPDGSKIAFASSRNRKPYPFPNISEIFVMDANGSNVRQLTDHSSGGYYEDSHPMWSPDGSTIAFVSHRDGRDDLYEVDVAGNSAETPLLENWSVTHPSWSPDGTDFVFSRQLPDYEGVGMGIYRWGAADVVPELLHSESDIQGVSYSPDGSQIAFAGGTSSLNRELNVMSASGSNVQTLSSEFHWFREPTWSPDGEHIIFAATTSSSDSDENGVSLWVVDKNGQNQQRLTVDAHRYTSESPDWTTGTL